MKDVVARPRMTGRGGLRPKLHLTQFENCAELLTSRGRRIGSTCSASPKWHLSFDLRLIVQNDIQQCTVDFDAANLGRKVLSSLWTHA
jgi:hypothetical protein